MKDITLDQLYFFRLSIIVCLTVLVYTLYSAKIIRGYLPQYTIVIMATFAIMELLNILLAVKSLKKNKSIPLEKPLYCSLFSVKSLFILISLLFFFWSSFYLPFIMKTFAEKNKILLKEIVTEITRNATTDREKALAILKWFDRNAGNINNVWGKKLLIRIYPVSVYLEPPYFCIRLIGHENPLWVLTSRCGACDEYALLYMEMANEAGLIVRSIHNHGENHNWDEVLIDGKWIIIDPAAFLFDPPPSYYEINRTINISYVFALYPNGTIEDVTTRYTKVGTLIIKTKNKDGKPLSNVSVYILSNNYALEMKTGLNCTTDFTGECIVQIGGGNYTLVAIKEGLVPLFNKTKVIVREGKTQNVELILHQDPTILLSQFGVFLYPVIPVLLWMLLVLYFRLLSIQRRELN